MDIGRSGDVDKRAQVRRFSRAAPGAQEQNGEQGQAKAIEELGRDAIKKLLLAVLGEERSGLLRGPAADLKKVNALARPDFLGRGNGPRGHDDPGTSLLDEVADFSLKLSPFLGFGLVPAVREQ